ncbi:MAG: hypothetical protein H6704_10650 [Myxococcales bacterium]|nr:hypothetical protein [Myxococcales bacterium]
MDWPFSPAERAHTDAPAAAAPCPDPDALRRALERRAPVHLCLVRAAEGVRRLAEELHPADWPHLRVPWCAEPAGLRRALDGAAAGALPGAHGLADLLRAAERRVCVEIALPAEPIELTALEAHLRAIWRPLGGAGGALRVLVLCVAPPPAPPTGGLLTRRTRKRARARLERRIGGLCEAGVVGFVVEVE